MLLAHHDPTLLLLGIALGVAVGITLIVAARHR